MSLKLVFLLGFVIVVVLCTTKSRWPKRRSCPIRIDWNATRKNQVDKKLPSCTDFAKLTKEEKENFDYDCVAKCILENKGIFDKKGNFIDTGIREYFTKFSNASENYIKAIQQVYVDCKKSSELKIVEMKKNGTVVTDCKFYYVFTDCTFSGRLNVQDC